MCFFFSLDCFFFVCLAFYEYMTPATMEHAGVSFPEEYVPHGVKLLYNGEPIDLTPDQEEAVTFFASMDPDGMHLGNPKTAPIFIKNFWSDFRTILTNTTTTKTTGGGGGSDGGDVAQNNNKKKLKDFAKCDFEPIRRYLNEQKIIKKAITDEQKKANKYVFFVLLLYCLMKKKKNLCYCCCWLLVVVFL